MAEHRKTGMAMRARVPIGTVPPPAQAAREPDRLKVPVGDLRPDVGGAFGSGRFTPSGWHLNTTLAPGDYQLYVFSFSTVANTFNNTQVIPFKVR